MTGISTTALSTAQAATSVTVFTDQTRTLNGPFRGFGVQEDAHMLWSPGNASNGVVVPADFDTYVRPRLEAMKLPWVRKFVDLRTFANTPGSYTWDTPEMQGLYTDLQALEDSGTEVMLTIWLIPSWMTDGSEGCITGTTHRFPCPQSSPNYATYSDQWASVVTDLMKHLYGTDGSGHSFSNVKYLGAPNELSHTTVAGLVQPYTMLDQKLTTAGIRANVTMFGPDQYSDDANLTKGSDSIRRARNNVNLNPLLGFYDFHSYAYAPVEATYISTIESAMAEASVTAKQVWITEAGNRTFGNNGDGWRSLATMAIDGVNHGAAGISAWNLQDQAYGDGAVLEDGMWGLWAYKDENWVPKPSYYAWSNVTAHTARDSLVYGNSCDTENCPGLRVAALNDQQGHNTVLAYNTSTSAQDVDVAYSGASPTETLYRYVLDPATLPNPCVVGDAQGYDKVINLTAGTFSDTLPAGAFAVYSSLNPVADNPPGILLDDDFNDNATASAPCGWSTVTGGSGPPTVRDVPSAADKSVQLVSLTGAGSSMSRSVPAQTGSFTSVFKFRQPSPYGGFKATLKDGAGTAGVVIRTDGGQIKYTKSGGANVTVQPYTAGIWYEVTVVVNVATDTYDIYVDGVLKTTGATFAQPVADISTATHFSGVSTPSGGTYVDAVKVTTP